MIKVEELLQKQTSNKMSLTSGTYKVQILLQNIIPPPFHIDSQTHLSIQSPLYNRPFHRYYRLLSQFLILFIFLPITIFRLGWLFFHWKSYTVLQFEQAIIYFIFLCLFSIVLPTFQMNHSLNIENIYLLNQFQKINKRLKMSTLIPSKMRFSAKEYLIYALALGHLQLIPAFIGAPFFLPYLHLQIIFGSSLSVKICETFLYGMFATYGSTIAMITLLFSLVVAENLQSCSLNIYSKVTSSSSIKPKLRFSYCYKQFRCTQIVLKIVNRVYSLYLLVLIFVGILLASCCAYVTVRMYGNVHIIIYITFPALAFLCFAVALLLTFLGSTPNKQTKKFKTFWALDFLRIEDRKRLRACKPTGFVLGPYGVCTSKLGLHICDDIVHNTVTMILLDYA